MTLKWSKQSGEINKLDQKALTWGHTDNFINFSYWDCELWPKILTSETDLDSVNMN